MDVILPVYLSPKQDGHTDPALVESTRQCIESLYTHAELAPPDIYLIENGGAYIRAHYPDIMEKTAEYHSWKDNRGIARAWNMGMHMSTSKIVLIVNNDCDVLTKGWDAIALDYFQMMKGLGVLFPTEEGHPYNSQRTRYFGAFFFVSRHAWTAVGRCSIPPYPGGKYEDALHFRKLERGGFHCCQTRMITVKHGMSKTIRQMPDYRMQIERNKRWYEAILKGWKDADLRKK